MSSDPTSPRGPVITRRSFVERLGLGAGAAILSPIAQTLVSEARGLAAVSQRKRAAFFVLGDCFLSHMISPVEFSDQSKTVLDGATNYTLPDCCTNLEPVRNRILLIDGLANAVTGTHSGGYLSDPHESRRDRREGKGA